ncbi:MAG: hypothetical protein KDE26_07855, partial [Bacteroidetes bacterium]|nr:hypothetical protein [Bacteroidota bacterium]
MQRIINLLLAFLLFLATIPSAWAGDMSVTVYQSDGSTPFPGVKIMYYDGYWKLFGTTDGSGETSLNIPDGTYNFRAEYEGTKVEQNLTVSGLSSGTFYSTQVKVRTMKSDGVNLSGIDIDYYSGYWRNFGSVSGGKVIRELFPGSYNFRASKEGTSATQNVNIPGDGTASGSELKVWFYATKVEFYTKYSDGSPYSGVKAEYYSGYWRQIQPETNSSGLTTRELFPGTFTFRASKDGTSATQSATITGDGATPGSTTPIYFYTTKVNIYAKESGGDPLQDVLTAFYSGYWRNIGNTNSSGLRCDEFFPGTYNFRASIDGTSSVQNVAIAGDGTTPGASSDMTFYTTEVTFEVKGCDATPIPVVACAYYSGYWRTVGDTDASGLKSIEIFPGTFNFRASTGGTSETKNEIVPGDGTTSGQSFTIAYTPTKIDYTFHESVKYYSGYWREITGVTYLFPGTYNFKFGDYATSVVISGCDITQTIVYIKLIDSYGNGIQGQEGFYRIGSTYYSAGLTDANGKVLAFMDGIITNTYFKMNYLGHDQTKLQNIVSDPEVIFQTVLVTVEMKDSYGDPLAAEELFYRDGSGTYVSLGTNT